MNKRWVFHPDIIYVPDCNNLIINIIKNLSKIFLLFLLATMTITSCKKDNSVDPVIKAVNQGIYDLMKEVYLWNDHLPASIDPSAYATPNDLMDALRYKVYDRWSTVLTI